MSCSMTQHSNKQGKRRRTDRRGISSRCESTRPHLRRKAKKLSRKRRRRSTSRARSRSKQQAVKNEAANGKPQNNRTAEKQAPMMPTRNGEYLLVVGRSEGAIHHQQRLISAQFRDKRRIESAQQQQSIAAENSKKQRSRATSLIQQRKERLAAHCVLSLPSASRSVSRIVGFTGVSA